MISKVNTKIRRMTRFVNGMVAVMMLLSLVACHRVLLSKGITQPIYRQQIVPPLQKIAINQLFGEYLGEYEGILYDGYHTGLDLEGDKGTVVYAMAAGRVTKVAPAFDDPNDGGWYTVITHPQLDLQSVYVHTDKPIVTAGQSIVSGQPIAILMTPKLFPAHLHVEVQKRGTSVINAQGQATVFVNQTTQPVGNRGYLKHKEELNRIWLDPLTFFQH